MCQWNQSLPEISSLSLKCTENNCERVFTKRSGLNMHIIKSHGIERNNTKPSKNKGRPKGSQNIKQKIRITNLLTSLEEKLSRK